MSADPVPIRDVIERAGGVTKLSAHIGRAHSTVLDWTRVPAEHAMKVSEITGIPLHELRPDVYPAPLSRDAA